MKVWLLLLLLGCISCVKAEEGFSPQEMPLDSIMNLQSDYVVVLGDLQEYTGNKSHLPWLHGTIDWLISQRQHGVNISCVWQVGDITAGNTEQEWVRFHDAFKYLKEYTPLIACVGNHDYTWSEDGTGLIEDRYSTLFSNFVLYDEARVASRFEANRNENIVVECQIGETPYYMINLEYGPREEVVKWACEYVSMHPDKRFMLLVHEFLTSAGCRVDAGSGAEVQLRNTNFNTPKQIWEKMISRNDNILCVICGHNGFTAHLQSGNSAGRQVSQILFNIQYQPNGGDGWVQIWEFPRDKDSVVVRTYNTMSRNEKLDSMANFKFKYR